MLQITNNNTLLIDGKSIGLSLVQCREGTIVYSPESRLSGRAYREHKMPHRRYSTAHDTPASGTAGLVQLESDLRELISRLG